MFTDHTFDDFCTEHQLDPQAEKLQMAHMLQKWCVLTHVMQDACQLHFGSLSGSNKKISKKTIKHGSERHFILGKLLVPQDMMMRALLNMSDDAQLDVKSRQAFKQSLISVLDMKTTRK